MLSLKGNASDVDVFNKASLRAAGQEEAQLTNSYTENNEAKVNNSIYYHNVSNLIQG